MSENYCLDNTGTMKMIGCAVNASLGNENKYSLNKAEKSKKVVVIGGGPAGMEAARVAALRGHMVTLFEKEDTLGGQLIPAGIAPYKQPINVFSKYLSLQVKKSGVTLKLHQQATAESIEQVSPDEVIIATGASPLIPEIPGITSDHVVTAIDVLMGRKTVGDRIVILGGELVACDTAEFLADKGKKVIMLKRSPRMAMKVSPAERQVLLYRLGSKGVVMLTGVKYEKITNEGLVITDKHGKTLAIKADNIILATGAKPNLSLAQELKSRGIIKSLHMIGDCAEPARIAEAIQSAARIAREI